MKNRECLSGSGEVGVPDAFREVSDHGFVNGVIDVDPFGEVVDVEGEVGMGGGCGGDWTEDESGGRGTREGVGGSSGVKVVHYVARGGGELESRDFKGHMTVAERLGKVSWWGCYIYTRSLTTRQEL